MTRRVALADVGFHFHDRPGRDATARAMNEDLADQIARDL
jgi:hypothetical protein